MRAGSRLRPDVDVAARAPRTNSHRCDSVTVNAGPDLGLPVRTTPNHTINQRISDADN